MITYDKERGVYRVYTLGGYIETPDKAVAYKAAQEVGRGHYLASVQGGYLPANLRRAGST